MLRPYVIFSSLTEDKGHLLLDDLFWFKNLSKIDCNTKIYSSMTALNWLATQIEVNNKNKTFFEFSSYPTFQKISYRLHLICKILFSKPITNSNVIVQGFDEIAMFFFFWKVKGQNNKIALIPTNNISPERIARSRSLLCFLLKNIFKRCDKIFYHTNYELKLILNLIPDEKLYGKYAKLKYNLLWSQPQTCVSNNGSKTISFFGPTMPSKPIESIIKLILADEERKYEYLFINVNEKDKAFVKLNITSDQNIKFFNGYLPHDEYIQLIQSSKYIFLPHNYLYEGKLSGILSDSIANGIPIISDKIEPVVEFFNDYGKMGHIFDFVRDANWATSFLKAHNDFDYNSFITCMQKCRLAHNPEVIIAEFIKDFS